MIETPYQIATGLSALASLALASAALVTGAEVSRLIHEHFTCR